MDKDYDAADDNKEPSEAWMDSDRDYSYYELLKRVFGLMRDLNPDMLAGKKKKFVTCHMCRSPDTILNRETIVWFP